MLAYRKGEGGGQCNSYEAQCRATAGCCATLHSSYCLLGYCPVLLLAAGLLPSAAADREMKMFVGAQAESLSHSTAAQLVHLPHQHQCATSAPPHHPHPL